MFTGVEEPYSVTAIRMAKNGRQTRIVALMFGLRVFASLDSLISVLFV